MPGAKPPIFPLPLCGLLSLVLGVAMLGTPAEVLAASGSSRASPALLSLTIEPAQLHLHGSNRQQQLLITGHTANGQVVDVTQRCELASSDPSVVTVAGSRVQGVRDGDARVRVRLGNVSATVSARVSSLAAAPPVHFLNDVMPLFSKLG